ncbi:AP2/ERF domain-containing protein PFD0985w-like isoform X2 [Nylanderia fulva]|uniref:AP2/ERF domain-containing protein PFD0985w-like isoform X2 n=1 Tax=Nylanderia fulva TaxID=613905 RepID=UPI0010FB4378|nr:AP2/ERF domain-containing protein PFD0985w-like isoform X2 [Nylanderia fulva]
MSGIEHEFWDKIFESQRYENIDGEILSQLQNKVTDMKKEFSIMQQVFKKICKKIFGTPIKEKPEEDTSKDFQNNIGSTTSRKQLEREEVTDSTPSEIDNEKNELMNKYHQFVEIIYQDEVLRIKNQISNYSNRHYKTESNVRVAMEIEYFTNVINLINNLLHRENEVLKFKIEREEMRTKVKPCEIDYEKYKLLMDNRYLQFVKTIRQEEIKRIFIQFESYCAMYNMPNEEEDLIIYKAFIMERIEELKKFLGLSGQVMEFNLQIERKATNMETNVETNNPGTSKMSSNANNLNMLWKTNEYLQYIAMMHQEEINRLYVELERYCNDDYNRAINNEYQTLRDDDIKKTNKVPKNNDEKCDLKKDNENLRLFAVVFEAEFNKIYEQLLIHCNKYAMSNENVTIVMHTEAYDPTKTNHARNELKKENEYLAFIAMMHLEKMREILFFFEMFRKRFCDTIEKITKTDSFLNQQMYMTNEIFDINSQISLQRGFLNNMANMYEITFH